MSVPGIAAASTPRLDHDLARGIAALRIDVPAATQSLLLDYLALLAKWNATYNLTAVREPQRMVTHHLLDALAVLPHLPQREGLRVLDVGSGCGVPGIPLALARPDWHVALVDSNHKKVAFLTQAAIELRMTNVETHTKRVEEFAPALAFDVVISRAFADLATFAATSLRHVAPGGFLVAMKGVYPSEELAELPAALRVIATPSLVVPGLDGARHLVVMQRADAP